MWIDANGVKTYANTGGQPFNAELPTLVFLHGAAMDHTVWSQQSRYFAHHGYGVLALDMPGCGRSEGPPLTTIEALAEWLAACLSTVGAGPARLVGHSQGALVSLELAAARPELVAAVVLAGAAVPMPVNDGFLGLAEANDHQAIEMMTDWAFGRPSHIGGNIVPGSWMIGSTIRLVERAAPGVLHAGLASCNDYQAGMDAAAKVKCPVLLLLAEFDLMTPARAARPLAEALAASRTEILPGVGHLMMMEAPDATLAAIEGFLSQA